MPQGYAYIDGFNLHHGIEDAGLQQFLLLDLRYLSMKILRHFGHQLELVRYFTARVADSHASSAWQRQWLDSVRMMAPVVRTEFGRFRDTSVQCERCLCTTLHPREKQSDVHLGVRMVEDLYTRRPTAMLLISGDTDQMPTIAAIRRFDNQFPLFLAFPPKRQSDELRYFIGKKHTVVLDAKWLADCLLPDNSTDGIGGAAIRD